MRKTFSIEDIKHYLEGQLLVGEHKENDMLNYAISIIDDEEDGIVAESNEHRRVIKA